MIVIPADFDQEIALEITVVGIYLSCLCQYAFYSRLVIGSAVLVCLGLIVKAMARYPKVTQANCKSSIKNYIAFWDGFWLFRSRV